MQCPFCDTEETSVMDTRKRGEHVRRRRECKQCNRRFSSVETWVKPTITVRKRHGGSETFDEGKLRASLERALHDRPQAASLLEQSLRYAVRAVIRTDTAELSWDQLAKTAAEALEQVDEVARIRFIAKYRIMEERGERALDDATAAAQISFDFPQGAERE